MEDDTKVLIISENYNNMRIVHEITQTLDRLGINSEYKVISPNRSPDKLEKYMKDADNQVDFYIVYLRYYQELLFHIPQNQLLVFHVVLT